MMIVYFIDRMYALNMTCDLETQALHLCIIITNEKFSFLIDSHLKNTRPEVYKDHSSQESSDCTMLSTSSSQA
jgi:hypothetical protein